jgi:hypothetical protein
MEFEKYKNNALDKADEMLRSNAQKVFGYLTMNNFVI